MIYVLVFIIYSFRASIPHTDGQLRNILPDMESNDLDDQVRNTQPDVEPIDIEYLEYLLEDNQRVVNFLTVGTQEDKQRFMDLLNEDRPRMGGSERSVTSAPDSSQTEYICLRSGPRDRPFPHTPN
jgi:hypothetical protein